MPARGHEADWRVVPAMGVVPVEGLAKTRLVMAVVEVVVQVNGVTEGMAFLES